MPLSVRTLSAVSFLFMFLSSVQASELPQGSGSVLFIFAFLVQKLALNVTKQTFLKPREIQGRPQRNLNSRLNALNIILLTIRKSSKCSVGSSVQHGLDQGERRAKSYCCNAGKSNQRQTLSGGCECGEADVIKEYYLQGPDGHRLTSSLQRLSGILSNQVSQEFCTYMPSGRQKKNISHVCVEEISRK